MKHRSFISERTAEYLLVPDLLRRLAPHSQQIIPIYFWGTREGNRTAALMMQDVDVRIIAAFPRRPKIQTTRPNRVTVKFNQELLAYSRTGTAMGVPVIAGVPLVTSLRCLSHASQCAWFDLQPIASGDGDYFVEVTSDGLLDSDFPQENSQPIVLSDSDMKKLVSDSAVYTWDSAVDVVRSLRRSAREFSGAFMYGGYRPFHCVLIQG